MKSLREKLLIGDYYQYFTYPIRKQIVHLFKSGETKLLEQVLTGLINEKHQMQLEHDIQVITIFDAAYPPLLLQTYDPPLVLYARGDIKLLEVKEKLAVIGSRAPRAYSLDALKKIFDDLAKKDVKPVIVSGLAKGVDGRSHQLALQQHMATIAVLGFGFNYMYPPEHAELANSIAKSGLLLSEYPPHMGVHPWQFVARNRILAGLCQVIVIIEAKEKSGSLITAELALAENREVYIVSGQSFDGAYEGSHMLIQDGAKLLLHIEEVLAEYNVK